MFLKCRYLVGIAGIVIGSSLVYAAQWYIFWVRSFRWHNRSFELELTTVNRTSGPVELPCPTTAKCATHDAVFGLWIFALIVSSICLSMFYGYSIYNRRSPWFFLRSYVAMGCFLLTQPFFVIMVFVIDQHADSVLNVCSQPASCTAMWSDLSTTAMCEWTQWMLNQTAPLNVSITRKTFQINNLEHRMATKDTSWFSQSRQTTQTMFYSSFPTGVIITLLGMLWCMWQYYKARDLSEDVKTDGVTRGSGYNTLVEEEEDG